MTGLETILATAGIVLVFAAWCFAATARYWRRRAKTARLNFVALRDDLTNRLGTSMTHVDALNRKLDDAHRDNDDLRARHVRLTSAMAERLVERDEARRAKVEVVEVARRIEQECQDALARIEGLEADNGQLRDLVAEREDQLAAAESDLHGCQLSLAAERRHAEDMTAAVKGLARAVEHGDADPDPVTIDTVTEIVGRILQDDEGPVWDGAALNQLDDRVADLESVAGKQVPPDAAVGQLQHQMTEVREWITRQAKWGEFGGRLEKLEKQVINVEVFAKNLAAVFQAVERRAAADDQINRTATAYMNRVTDLEKKVAECMATLAGRLAYEREQTDQRR